MTPLTEYLLTGDTGGTDIYKSYSDESPLEELLKAFKVGQLAGLKSRKFRSESGRSLAGALMDLEMRGGATRNSRSSVKMIGRRRPRRPSGSFNQPRGGVSLEQKLRQKKLREMLDDRERQGLMSRRPRHLPL